MAGGAFAFIRPVRELAGVGVGVAVSTLPERNGLFEIATLMARNARHLSMLADERIFGLGMIKAFFSSAGLYRLPGCGVVAGRTRCGERAFVRIGMAGAAFIEFNSSPADWPTRLRWRMAFFTCDTDMCSGERIPRAGVIKIGYGFPVGRVVTLLAGPAQLALVKVFMASDTRFLQAQERTVQVFILDERLFGGINLVGRVTFGTPQPRMLAGKCPAGLRVIKFFQ